MHEPGCDEAEREERDVVGADRVTVRRISVQADRARCGLSASDREDFGYALLNLGF
jgi:hypothetical protein